MSLPRRLRLLPTTLRADGETSAGTEFDLKHDLKLDQSVGISCSSAVFARKKEDGQITVMQV